MSDGIDRYLAHASEEWGSQIAVRCGDDALSYADLRRAALALAAHLADRGVRKGDRVAIAMTKGVEMAVAIHAIWLAGGAFVPFDVFAPRDRLLGLIDTCDIGCVLTSRRDHRIAGQLAAERAVDLIDASEMRGAAVPGDFVPSDNGADDIAYIIFTSGSTGTPKGIVHTHASGSAFAEMWARLYAPKPGDVLFCTVPLHFDFSLADFFAAPIGGATTELVPEAVQRFPSSLAQLLETCGATIWSTVPFALIQLLEHGALAARDLSRLRCIIYGGEAMSPVKLAALREVVETRISNSYGPAEVNQCTEYTVPVGHPEYRPIPIGRATDHAALHIDEGELLVATPAMMQGYWRRPDLNARVFAEIDGRRYYRTGDSVRQDDQGLLHFLGRSDRQVKVRGFRIELDEVERALAAHPAVSEAAAVLVGEGQSIGGFVTLCPGRTVTEKDLRAHLATILPPYAIPAEIGIKADFERTGTGKIDRRILGVEK